VAGDGAHQVNGFVAVVSSGSRVHAGYLHRDKGQFQFNESSIFDKALTGRRVFKAFRSPVLAAKCKGVSPLSSLAFTSTFSAFMRMSKASGVLPLTKKCNAVQPSSSI